MASREHTNIQMRYRRRCGGSCGGVRSRRPDKTGGSGQSTVDSGRGCGAGLDWAEVTRASRGHVEVSTLVQERS